MMRLNQNGSHVVAVALGIVVVAVIGFAGYRVMNNQQTVTDTTTPLTTKPVAAPATITTKADLSQTAQSLDSSSADLNSGLNSDSLNTDLNSLL